MRKAGPKPPETLDQRTHGTAVALVVGVFCVAIGPLFLWNAEALPDYLYGALFTATGLVDLGYVAREEYRAARDARRSRAAREARASAERAAAAEALERMAGGGK